MRIRGDGVSDNYLKFRYITDFLGLDCDGIETDVLAGGKSNG